MMNRGPIFLFLLIVPPAHSVERYFSKGAESFKFLDSQGKSPVILRILESSSTKKALALALNAATGETDPKPYLDVKLEKLVLKPKIEQPDKLNLHLQASGQIHDLNAVVFKKDLLAGKAITIKLIPREDEVGVFSVTTNGRLTLRLDPVRDILHIDSSSAKIDFESPMSSPESESLSFSGQAKLE